jgi:hypothetical protein
MAVDVAEYDVIQISPEVDVNPVFKGKVAIVDEPRTWGCIAYVETFTGRAYVRLQQGTYKRLGKLEWIEMYEYEFSEEELRENV